MKSNVIMSTWARPNFRINGTTLYNTVARSEVSPGFYLTLKLLRSKQSLQLSVHDGYVLVRFSEVRRDPYNLFMPISANNICLQEMYDDALSCKLVIVQYYKTMINFLDAYGKPWWLFRISILLRKILHTPAPVALLAFKSCAGRRV